jgi:hypothetical protein
LRLKKTLAEILDLTEEELILWSAFFELEHERRDHAAT